MGEVLDIADHRPHLMVVASDAVHVIPQALIRDVVAGTQPSSILTEPVVQRIIEEWLESLGP
jgi:predicted transcriptional regulator